MELDGLQARPLMPKALESGNYDEIVDPRLEGHYDPQEMARMISAASASIRHSARMRPKMSQVQLFTHEHNCTC